MTAMNELQQIIEQAWEDRASLSPGKRRRASAMPWPMCSGELDSRHALRVAEKIDGQWTTHQWIKKAVLLSFRLERQRVMDGGPMRYFDKVPTKFAHYDTYSRREGRLPRGAPGRGPARQLHRQGRGADALLREHRRLRRRRHHGRHLGHRRLLRPDRQERAPVRWRRHRRRAGADAGQPDHHRRQLLHRRPLGSRRRRHRRRQLA
jgi:hypothetical protein